MTASTPAAAEVCDKVRPAWNPADGPVTQFDDLALFFIEPLGLIVLVLAIAAVLLRKIWFTVFVVTLLVATIALNISTWVEADDVTNFALSEGCIAAPVLTTTTLVAICAIFSVATWHSSRRRRQAG
ncbi:hypothetical protein [uncultured Tateyamaria sp.]|uniref:hypothetical protein n=1 Tax=uncultured Tateyamaria sp. TaxID=455651 RepID=UPI00260379E8|nr:hypothetical protein [uncultured Tateyamaria sp.]